MSTLAEHLELLRRIKAEEGASTDHFYMQAGIMCHAHLEEIASLARKSPRTDMGDDLERLIEQQDARNQSTGRVNCVHVPIRQARAILSALRTGEATDV